MSTNPSQLGRRAVTHFMCGNTHQMPYDLLSPDMRRWWDGFAAALVADALQDERLGKGEVISSKAALLYPGRGMNFGCYASTEYEAPDSHWYRAELCTSDLGRQFSASYRRENAHWIPFSNQTTAMMLRQLVEQQDPERKEAA